LRVTSAEGKPLSRVIPVDSLQQPGKTCTVKLYKPDDVEKKLKLPQGTTITLTFSCGELEDKKFVSAQGLDRLCTNVQEDLFAMMTDNNMQGSGDNFSITIQHDGNFPLVLRPNNLGLPVVNVCCNFKNLFCLNSNNKDHVVSSLQKLLFGVHSRFLFLGFNARMVDLDLSQTKVTCSVLLAQNIKEFLAHTKHVKVNKTPFNPDSLNLISLPSLSKLDIDYTEESGWGTASKVEFVLRNLCKQAKSTRNRMTAISCCGPPFGLPEAQWKGGSLSKQWPALKTVYFSERENVTIMLRWDDHSCQWRRVPISPLTREPIVEVRDEFDIDFESFAESFLQQSKSLGKDFSIPPAVASTKSSGGDTTTSYSLPRSGTNAYGGNNSRYKSANNPYKGGASPYKGNAAYAAGESPYAAGESPYGAAESPYGAGESPYAAGESPYGADEDLVEEDNPYRCASDAEEPEEEQERSAEAQTSSSSTNSEDESELKFLTAPSGERDWDAEYQEICKMDPNDIRKHKLMARLADDFQNVASTYGQIIISERALEYASKTIKPVSNLVGELEEKSIYIEEFSSNSQWTKTASTARTSLATQITEELQKQQDTN